MGYLVRLSSWNLCHWENGAESSTSTWILRICVLWFRICIKSADLFRPTSNLIDFGIDCFQVWSHLACHSQLCVGALVIGAYVLRIPYEKFCRSRESIAQT